MKNNILVGQYGESAAAEYLTALGYEIKERNFRTPTGEIDIIAENEGKTVFVEVKSRSAYTNSRYGRPSNAVNFRKRKNFISAVMVYQKLHPESQRCRIDVIEVYFLNGNTEINHIKSAFGNQK